MARKADPDLVRRREKSGERLRKLLESRELQSKQFLMMMKERFGEIDETSEDGYYLEGLNSESALSKIINGYATLQNKHARMAAEILDIDVNYLLGTVDDFQESSYNDYLKYKEGPGQITDEWRKYKNILSIAGYRLQNIMYTDNTLTSFVVSRDKESTIIPVADMESFYKDVCRYVEKRLALVMDLNM